MKTKIKGILTEYNFDRITFDEATDALLLLCNSSQLLLCIDRGEWKNHLTDGKKYKLICESDETYCLIDDSGKAHYYNKDRFELVEA